MAACENHSHYWSAPVTDAFLCPKSVDLREFELYLRLRVRVRHASYVALLPFQINSMKCSRNATVDSHVALASHII